MTPPPSRAPAPPSSRTPAGVPRPSGNAKYAVVVVALLAAMGGIFWWRSSQAPQAAPPPVPSVSASTVAVVPTNPKEDDIPPPPPPEDKPEAGPGGRIVAGVGGGGCEVKTCPPAPAELGPALQQRAMQARRCYYRALEQDNSLKGHVTINVRIGPTGNVCSANVVANDMGTTTVAQCVANAFRQSGGYPAPHGPCAEANVPLSFVPQGQ